MSKVTQTGMEGWVHQTFHDIANKTGLDVDLVSEIIELWDNAKERDLVKLEDYPDYDNTLDKIKTLLG